MAKKGIKTVREQFGDYLRNHRENVLKERNLLAFSYSSKLDNSKLAKIEKGEIDIQFDTLMEVARTYKLPEKSIFGFEFKEVEG
ncbi:MAG TPA: hypothetical protein DCQ50_11790 [Chryseobacterium sp.]|nr:hypothetical protein [Chryseobacterium sp.]